MYIPLLCFKIPVLEIRYSRVTEKIVFNVSQTIFSSWTRYVLYLEVENHRKLQRSTKDAFVVDHPYLKKMFACTYVDKTLPACQKAKFCYNGM